MKKKHYIDIGKRLRKTRMALGLQQKEMAEAVGVKPPYLSSIENGRRNNPGIAILFEISKRYQVSLDYLVNGCGDMFLPSRENELKMPKKSPPDFNTIDDVLWLLKNSSFAKNAILSFIVRFYVENENFINIEMMRSKGKGKENPGYNGAGDHVEKAGLKEND